MRLVGKKGKRIPQVTSLALAAWLMACAGSCFALPDELQVQMANLSGLGV